MKRKTTLFLPGRTERISLTIVFLLAFLFGPPPVPPRSSQPCAFYVQQQFQQQKTIQPLQIYFRYFVTPLASQTSSKKDDPKKKEKPKIADKQEGQNRKKNLARLQKQIQFASASERKRGMKRVPYLKEKEKRPFIPLLEKLIKQDPDPSIRETAAHTLGRMKAKSAEKTLLTALEDRNRGVLRETVWALRRINSKRAGQPLADKIKQEDFQKNNSLLISMINYLGDIEYKKAAPFLLEKMKDYETHVEVRKTILLYMGHAKVQSMHSELVNILKDEDSDLGSRAFAANALGHLGNKSIAPLREEIKKIEEIPDSKTRAQYNKFKIQIVHALLRLGQKDMGKYILSQARSDEPRFRIRAARLISELKIAEGKEHLEYMSQYDPSAKVRKAAKEALENWGRKKSQRESN